MGKAAKLKAEKLRAKARAAKVAEVEALAANAQRLKTMTSGFGRTQRSADTEAQFKGSKFPQYVVTKDVQHHELEDRFTMGPQKRITPQVLDEEMLARERAAKEHYEQKMKPRIAPAYNKGGDMYLSEGELTAQMKGELRRRS